MRMQRALIVTIALAVTWFAHPANGSAESSFAAIRRAHPTRLLAKGPAPQQYRNEKPPPGVKLVLYPAASGPLQAWFAYPQKRGAGPVPTLVYFHGGYAFGADDFDDARPFLDAGFAVLAPMLRGENGNPGHFEMYFGEIDDARAAVAWVARQPGIDASRIFAFGHSAGGMVAALISLYDDPSPRLTGSAGGLYGESLFDMSRSVPFDLRVEEEWRLRVLWPNLDSMKKPHIGYLGTEDAHCRLGLPDLLRGLQRTKAPLTIIDVPGDHFESKPAAIKMFLERVRKL